jgi:hypothetical protein
MLDIWGGFPKAKFEKNIWESEGEVRKMKNKESEEEYVTVPH